MRMWQFKEKNYTERNIFFYGKKKCYTIHGKENRFSRDGLFEKKQNQMGYEEYNKRLVHI